MLIFTEVFGFEFDSASRDVNRLSWV